MNFAPAPANDFRDFIEQYFHRCREAYGRIVAIAGKWTFEDLVPGLSDFDTRFILRDPMTPDDWIAMSLAVGQVHTQMAREYPHWARNLEHLPGLNFTESEITNPLLYYPEFRQWTFYGGEEAVITRIRGTLSSRQWTRRDELFHLRKIATYIGPYQRGIDPPVNLGKWESKYPLHSRFMHYFAPPVQSAVSLASRGHFAGKLLALRAARHLFFNADVIDLALETISRHYETPDLYEDPSLARLERRLDETLLTIWGQLRGVVTLTEVGADDSSDEVRRKVAAIRQAPADAFLESVRFCRLMRGRLLFYSADIPWFDSTWLIHVELGRMRASLFEKPLAAYGLARFQQTLPASTVLERLNGDLLDPEETSAMLRWIEVLNAPISPGAERQAARKVADLFDPVLRVLEKLSASIVLQYPEQGVCS